MHSADLLSGWDTALVMAPFFILLAGWMFGLDERIASSKGLGPRPRAFSQIEHRGQAVMTDPDGRPWKVGRVFRGPARGLPDSGDDRSRRHRQ